MAEVTEPRVELTLNAENFAKLAQIGRDKAAAFGGKYRGGWGDREFAVYAITLLILDAEDRA